MKKPGEWRDFSLAFAERILPRASDLWVQASLDYKQRLLSLFFPEGIARVTLNFASWNRVVLWLRAVDELRRAA